MECGKASLEDFYNVFCQSSFYLHDGLKQLVEVFFETFNDFAAEQEINTENYCLVYRLNEDYPEIKDGFLERIPSQQSIGLDVGLKMNMYMIREANVVKYFIFDCFDISKSGKLMYFVFEGK
ncbi:MAG: hypothetical protein ACK5N8_07960 [Alphaproteobacteria bacterium]